MSNSDEEFEEQLRLEAAEKQREEDLKAGKLKVDPDGTVYDWDEEKKAWFPRIDEDFIARYQMSYGADVSNETTSEAKDVGGPSKDIPPPPSVNDPGYADWYYKYYGNMDSSSNVPYDTNSKEYKDWYNYYYGNAEDSKTTSESGNNETKELKNENKTGEGVSGSVESPEDGDEEARKKYEEYYAYYYQHYGQHPEQEGSKESGNNPEEHKPTLDPSHPEYFEQYHQQQFSQEKSEEKPSEKEDTTKKEDKEDEKKAKKRKPPEPPQWFEVDQSKSNMVYVAGMPQSITDQQFLELMNKCGLIAYDPRTRKPNMKLYKDENGKNKGDGRCCYIKPESIDLALQMLDGYDVDGHKISVERAKFELKGQYDPTKKKKKLSNSEKKKFKEKQEKLFDWRPDKPRGARNKWEKVVIVKNFFNPADFEKNPALINELRQDLREECSRFGDVKKVMIFDRHPEGIASVNFKTAEEADVCIEAINGRFFACKQISAFTWDGKSKYEIEETEEERTKRLKQWENFLEEDEEGKKTKKDVDKLADSGDAKGAVKGVEATKQDGSGASS